MVCSRSQCNNEKGSYLENVPAYTRNTTTDYYNELLNELNQRNVCKRQGRPPYLLSMIRCALHLRYMSIQAYRLLLEISPMPFSSLLNKIQQYSVDALKALKTSKRPFSWDCILMIDQVYLQKSAQYQSGGNIEERNLDRGIFAFLVVKLKESIPFVV